MSVENIELKDRLVSIQRVTKVTKGGRTFSFSAIVNSLDGRPFKELGKRTLFLELVIPLLTGSLPVKRAALLGVQTGAAE